MVERPRNDFRQHLLIETPEHVLLDYELAGVGSRTLAALIDWMLLFLLFMMIAAAFRTLALLGAWGDAFLLLTAFAVMSGYFTFFEGISEGQTPGKRVVGIRVIRDTGHAVSFADAAARNLMNLPDMMVVGVFLIMLHPRAKRLGDMVAGTVVVRDQPVIAGLAHQAAELDSGDTPLGPPELSDAEFKMLREFQARAAQLPVAARTRVARRLAEQLAAHTGPTTGGDLPFLAALHQAELARRQGRFGAKGQAGKGSPAERMVARKQERWAEFERLTQRVSHGGLDILAARELPDFAARYREIAADLARAQTYRADPVTLKRLERLVAAGHNALYRGEHRTVGKVWKFVAHDCPGEIVASWRSVLVATAMFVLPAVGGYAALRERPALSASIIPDVMLERSEAAAERLESGRGYVMLDGEERPRLAAQLIINNVRVSFRVFTGGIFLGIGSLFILAYNGLSIGTISGHFANAGLTGYLWSFIAGHGVLELFAIWVAGAAGLRLGLAVIAPGRLPRSDAIAIAGRRAMRMMAAVILFLLVAGMIEGLISAGDYSLATRLTVSGASLALLIAYLWNGARRTAMRVTFPHPNQAIA